MIVHCLSVDIEGFCEGMAESVPVPAEMLFSAEARAEIAHNVDEILAFLAEHAVKATFFILGRIAEDMPAVVRRIAAEGHEIGSHGFRHLRLYDLSPAAAQESISRSRKALQDATGTAVRGFRAPDFSIDGRTLDLLDVLLAAGYQYDSSLYPIGGHDVYGLPGALRWPHRLSNGLVEFPLSVFKVAGRRIPALGGGYFRLYPLGLTRHILRSIQRQGRPAMFYIHPYELGSRCPRLAGLSAAHRFRHYVNRTKTPARFRRLFAEFKFNRADEVLRAAGLLG